MSRFFVFLSFLLLFISFSSCLKKKCEQSELKALINYSGEIGDKVDIIVSHEKSRLDFSDYTYTLYSPNNEVYSSLSNDNNFTIECVSGKMFGEWRLESENKRCSKSTSFIINSKPIDCLSKSNTLIIDGSEHAFVPIYKNNLIYAIVGNLALVIDLKDYGKPKFDYSDYILNNFYNNSDPCDQSRFYNIYLYDNYCDVERFCDCKNNTNNTYSVISNNDGSYTFEFCDITFHFYDSCPPMVVSASITVNL